MAQDRKLKSPSELREEMEVRDREQTTLSNITTIEIDETVNGQRFKGAFTYKVPTLGDQILIGRMKSQYLPNGAAADPNAQALVEWLCYLEVTLQKPLPAWWKPMEFTASDVVAKLYSEVVAYANSFLGRGKDRGEAEGDDGLQDDGGDDPDAQGDVESEIQSPHQRSKVVIADSSRAK